MDYSKRHPLEAITNSKSLSMLEALIPFVDYPLKLPLALLIKYYEINRIMQAFQSLDNLSRCGLHNTSSDPMDMLCALTGISPDIMKMVSSFSNSQGASNPMDLMSMFGEKNGFDPKTFSNLFANFSGSNGEPNHTTNQSDSNQNDSSFDQNIQSIFSEYDMMQAAEYDSELDHSKNSDND
ncbi:MAG: hypothetical protein K2I10_04210 [Lachnospiraceae bacterium]|nr:hypothetical protein [Lachnospiraceae bacterium]